MNRVPTLHLVLVLSLSLLIPAVVTTTAHADSRIDEAIDKGIVFLLKQVEGKQLPDKHKVGQLALETYALVVAGVSVEHPLIQKNFTQMQRSSLNHTYTVSCIIFALDAALSQIEADQFFITGRQPRVIRSGSKFRTLLEKAVKAMVRIRQKSGGSWNYGPGGNRYDNSNTQFAVLALGVGAKRKIPIPSEVWQEIANHFIKGQQEKGPEVSERIELIPAEERGESKNKKIQIVNRAPPKKKKNGEKSAEKESQGRTIVKPVPEFGDETLKVYARGWNYGEGRKGATWNMTTAGLSSQILAAQNLSGKVTAEFLNKLNKSIRDGYGWVMKNWTPHGGGNPVWKYYGIYSLEKVGDLGEVRKFGTHDWYEEVSSHVVGQQRDDGSWGADNSENTRIATSLALLVLNRATSLLTQRSNRMVITGPGAHRDKDDRENWVYVQSLDREFHLPTLFRILRLRPNPRLAKFVNLVVDNYPPERNGNLIPGLVSAYEQLTDPRFKTLLLDKMAEITGVEYEEPKKYHVWYRRWKDVDEVGTLIKKDQTEWLIKIYEKTKQSVPLREKIIWAITRIQASKAIPLILEDLNHEELKIREAAYIALTTMPLRGAPPPPFRANASAKIREAQTAAIVEWYKSVGG